MAPPPFIPSLEAAYDRDISVGLEGLHQNASDELFSAESAVKQPVRTLGTLPKATASQPSNNPSVVPATLSKFPRSSHFLRSPAASTPYFSPPQNSTIFPSPHLPLSPENHSIYRASFRNYERQGHSAFSSAMQDSAVPEHAQVDEEPDGNPATNEHGEPSPQPHVPRGSRHPVPPTYTRPYPTTRSQSQSASPSHFYPPPTTDYTRATPPPVYITSPYTTSPHVQYSPQQHSQHQQRVAFPGPYPMSPSSHMQHTGAPFSGYQQSYGPVGNLGPEMNMAMQGASTFVGARGMYSPGPYMHVGGEGAGGSGYPGPTSPSQGQAGSGPGGSSPLTHAPPGQSNYGGPPQPPPPLPQLSVPQHPYHPGAQQTLGSPASQGGQSGSPFHGLPFSPNIGGLSNMSSFASFASNSPAFTHAAPSLYAQYTPPMYAQQYMTLNRPHIAAQPPLGEEQAQGTWWYLPPPTTPSQTGPTYELQGPFSLSYPPSMESTPSASQTAYLGSHSSGSPIAISPHQPRFSHHHPQQPAIGGAAAGGRAGPSSLHPSRGGGHTAQSHHESSPPPVPHTPSSPSEPRPSRSQPKGGGAQAEPANPSKSGGSRALEPSKKGTSPPRKPYHPSVPAHRSEWVMWVGNVPSDATHDELWSFFNDPGHVHIGSSGPRQLQPQSGPSTAVGQASEETSDGGVSSVFLISQSNCAFVNFNSESNLTRAIAIFNGKPLRPRDHLCPRLVCRIRRKDDDLRAGVGAQRGMGMHTGWIKSQADAMQRSGSSSGRELASNLEEASEGQEVDHPHLRSHDDPPTSPSTHLALSSSSDMSPPAKTRPKVDLKSPAVETAFERLRLGPQQQRSADKSNSTDSTGSTTSSFLSRYFPKRYFILKSLSEHDLILSVKRGLWATQTHNEPILDQAYRSSREVYLIFSANKSGEFFGYARMDSPVSKNERRVSWASRTDSSSSRSVGSPGVHRQASQPTILEDAAGEEALDDVKDHPAHQRPSPIPRILNTPTVLAASPGQITPGESKRIRNIVPEPHSTKGKSKDLPGRELNTAPAELGPKHKRVTYDAQPAAGTVDLTDFLAKQRNEDRGFELDPSGPSRAATMDHARHRETQVEDGRDDSSDDSPGGNPAGIPDGVPDGAPDGVPGNTPGSTKGKGLEETWGTPFKIKWIRTDRLPFHRTRHLRNRWNYDREVKVSRDGTEIEPTTGEALLREWDRLITSPPPSPPPPRQSYKHTSGRGRAGTSGGGSTRQAEQ